MIKGRSLSRAAGLAALASIACGQAPAASSGPLQRLQPPRSVDPSAVPASAAPDADPAPRGTVARARMLECGHQWNNMKRAGTASGTWKDFSRGCLAQR